MKKSVKEPRRRAPVKRRRRKKLGAGDRFRAVLVAAVLILTAAVSSLAAVYFHAARARNVPPALEAAVSGEAVASETDVPSDSGVASISQVPDDPGVLPSPSSAPPPVTPEPVSPLPVAPVPAVKPPSAGNQTTPRAVKAPPAEKAPAPVRPAAGSRPDNSAAGKRPVQNQPVENRPVENRPAPEALPPAGISERPPVSRGTLVFVIDDAGNNLRDLEPFLKISVPLTIAVLPGLPYSAEAARRVRAAGKELFLHQPMEALGGQNPGPGAIRAGMTRDEIRAVINRNLDEIWPVAGINNHEGSRITMDEDAMETVLSVCRERGIVFLDSRTTADTAAPRVAGRMGMSIGERDIFVDNDQDRESMNSYINAGLRKAEEQGSAIMIGHVWSAALAPLLADLLPNLRERGYSFSSASKVIGGAKL